VLAERYNLDSPATRRERAASTSFCATQTDSGNATVGDRRKDRWSCPKESTVAGDKEFKLTATKEWYKIS